MTEWFERYSDEPVDLSEMYQDLESENFDPEVSWRGMLGRLSPLRYEHGPGGSSLSRSSLGEPTEIKVEEGGYDAVLSPLRAKIQIDGEEEEAYELLEYLESTYDVTSRHDLEMRHPHHDFGL